MLLGLSAYRVMAAAGLLWSALLIALLLYGLAGVGIPLHLPTAAVGAISLVIGLVVAWPRAPDSISIGGAVIGVVVTVWAAWAAAVASGDLTLPILLVGVSGGVAVVFSVAAATVRSRGPLIDLILPLLTVGGTALLARLLTTHDGPLAFYLAPLAIAVLTGALRPSLLGSIGAWLGWSGGVALGWLVDAGDIWFTGPTVYGLLVAFLPHALASLARASFGPRVTAGKASR